MNWLKSIAVVALLCAFVLPPIVLAQEDNPPGSPKTPEEGEKPTEAKPAEEKPKAPEMDELSKKLLEGYEKSMYRLGRAGVKKATFTINAKMSSGDMEIPGKATYKWDGKKGTLSWDNVQLGMLLGQRGMSQEIMDKNFDDTDMIDKLEGGILTAAMNEDGTSKITVGGETTEGYKAFIFDENGIVSGIDLKKDVGLGAPSDIKTTLTYEKVGEQYLVSGMKFKFEAAGYGEINVETAFTFEKAGAFTVMSKTVTTQTLAGQSMGGFTATFTDWKLNDDVK